MPSRVSAHRLRGLSTTSAPHTAWSKPSARYGVKASSEACPPGPCPQSWPRAMASVRATLRRSARAMAAATWATSRAWVSRVRWWSAGKMKTWVLPASRRKAVAPCTMRSRSRSKQVRTGSGASGVRRSPAPWLRVAPGTISRASRSSRSSRSSGAPGATSAALSRWARRTEVTVVVDGADRGRPPGPSGPPTMSSRVSRVSKPSMVAAQDRARAVIGAEPGAGVLMASIFPDGCDSAPPSPSSSLSRCDHGTIRSRVPLGDTSRSSPCLARSKGNVGRAGHLTGRPPEIETRAVHHAK